MKTTAMLALLCLPCAPVLAQDLQGQLLGPDFCLARTYDAAHLAAHPDQTVTAIRVSRHGEMPQSDTDGLILLVEVERRGSDQVLQNAGYCQIGKTGDCGMEGDMGLFTLAARGNGAVVLAVGPYGMTFEDLNGYVTFQSDSGDDREFLLYPADPSVCQ